MIAAGIKNGDIRSTPRNTDTLVSLLIVVRPPIPELTNVPNLNGSPTFSSLSPLCSYASFAATSAKLIARS